MQRPIQRRVGGRGDAVLNEDEEEDYCRPLNRRSPISAKHVNSGSTCEQRFSESSTAPEREKIARTRSPAFPGADPHARTGSGRREGPESASCPRRSVLVQTRTGDDPSFTARLGTSSSHDDQVGGVGRPPDNGQGSMKAAQ